jgi:integrase
MATNFLDGVCLTTLAPGKHADGDGLYLDVRSATSASWVFKFVLHNKPYELGLGSLKRVDLEAARIKRAECIAELKAGGNPHASRKADKLEAVRVANAPKGQTIYELAKNHVGQIAKKVKTEDGRKSWVRSLHRDFIGHVADMHPADVTRDDVLPLMVKLYTGKDMDGEKICEAKPVQAEDIRQRLTKLLGWAYATDLIRTPNWKNPMKWEGNLEHLLDREAHTPKPHAELPFAEVGQFLADVRAKGRGTPGVKLALEWLVLSASRAGEATGADWSEIDWDNDCWVIPAERMKMRRRHRVPLTNRHHEILNELKGGADREAPASGLMFMAFRETGTSKQTLRCLQLTVRKGITLHGFRSSFATWARAETYEVIIPATGQLRRIRLYDEAMIEESLAHVVGDETRNAYVRDDFLEVRRPMLDAWAAYCGTVQSNVVQIRRRAIKVAA